MSPEENGSKLTGRKDHWLPRCYMQGFIGPSRKEEPRPLFCFEKRLRNGDRSALEKSDRAKGFMTTPREPTTMPSRIPTLYSDASRSNGGRSVS